MLFSKAVEGFVMARLADGYAPVTLAGYRSSLQTLCDYLGNPDITTITPENMRSFMAYLRTDYQPASNAEGEKLASASYHRYWKAFRSFFKWLNEEYKIERPDLGIKMPQYTNAEIIPFTEDEVRALLRACEHSQLVNDGKRKPYYFERPAMLRDKALVLLLLDTGVRSGECSRLRIEDVDMETGDVTVKPYHVKKTRPRVVHLGKAARKALWKYLATREDTQPDDPLFLSERGEAMNQDSIYKSIVSIAEAARVKDAHPHKFRHTFAIQYLRNGGDVFTLQRLLGHATLEMVRRYLAIAESDTKTAHNRASPVDRWRL